MMNTWPGGYRHAITQFQHRDWNSSNYPGTLQICESCGAETGRCEEDELCTEESGPLCEECYTEQAGGQR